MLSQLAQALVPYLIAPLYWLLSRSWTIREHGPAAVLNRHVRPMHPAPCVYAHWHGDELVLIGYYAHRRLAVLSSLSKDGSIMARTLSLLGYRVFRGSSSRGGARGLIGLIRAVQEGGQAALAVDGPRGPIWQVKPGIIELAHRTGHLIIPVRARCSSAWFFRRAWNRSYLPKPFARIDVEYGEPLRLPPELGDARSSCARVKCALDSLPGQFDSSPREP